jgi:uncharacterized protein YeaO (DUF488 family)
MVRIKRAYEAPADVDGYRVLVDRLWPRGVKKDITRRAARGMVTLVYGARDEEHNGAVVLRDEIMDARRTHAS